MDDYVLYYNRKAMERYKYSHYIKVFQWVNDLKNFVPYLEELKQIFRFKEEHIKNALSRLESIPLLTAQMHEPVIQNDIIPEERKLAMVDNQHNMTLISIHLRATDYETGFEGREDGMLQWQTGLSPVPNDYFTRAMEYFDSKYDVSSLKFHK